MYKLLNTGLVHLHFLRSYFHLRKHDAVPLDTFRSSNLLEFVSAALHTIISPSHE